MVRTDWPLAHPRARPVKEASWWVGSRGAPRGWPCPMWAEASVEQDESEVGGEGSQYPGPWLSSSRGALGNLPECFPLVVVV